jgi:hypothetical protein
MRRMQENANPGAGNGAGATDVQAGMTLTDPKRVQHFAAMFLIGDGVMALVHPSKDAHAWSQGPKVWRRLMHGLAERPALTMAIGATQVAIGIAWALQQSKDRKSAG